MELANHLNVCRETISAIENGKQAQLDTLGIPKLIKWRQICESNAKEAGLIKSIVEDLLRIIENGLR